jgi:hypothetical protein
MSKNYFGESPEITPIDLSGHRFRWCFFVEYQIDQLFFILQQGGEISEGLVLRGCFFLSGRSLILIPFLIQIARVLIVVTVETQKLPVASVKWVVIVVVILVVDGELTKFPAGEFAPASATDPRENLESLLPITLLPLASGLSDDPI